MNILRTSDSEIAGEIDRVFRLEIDTLSKVRESLGKEYSDAAQLLLDCPGKVVVTGIGKSGLIAQKIVGTMVSTGTSAIFLHASEAMHGDVGMVKKGDVLLAISKSGETEELLKLFPSIRETGVPIVSITAAIKSSIAEESDLVLFTPVDEEACPLNLAPTSSSTAALVVGDALAMTLMKMSGFQPENYALSHPGGQLGRRLLLRVADIMRSGDNNPTLHLDESVQQMLYEITNKRSGAVSIVDDTGQLLGLVTDHDIRQVLEESRDIFSLKISAIMNETPTYVYSDDKAIIALERMENRDKPFMVLPVLERTKNTVVGMVHLHDLVSAGL